MDSKKSILIVDDDEEICKILTLILERNGYETETSGTGRGAIEKARGRFFNVAILDIMLPDMEGVELLVPLKEMHPDMEVIMTTAYASLETAVRALNEGASAYITKVMNMDEVLAKIRKVLEKQHLLLENRRLYQEVQRELAERKRAEVELLRSRQMATLGMMASGLAHEINQPLQIILAIAQNCTRDIQRNAIDTEGILADLEHIAINTKRIDKIVNHLHVLAREHKPKLEAVDVNTVIENSFIMFHQQLKSRGIKIERNLSTDLPPVKADMVQLEQIFINLISNARDALEGRANRTITISTQEQNGHVQIKFQDNGKGISTENLPKIFDAFFTTKQEQGGIGLGLYIARDIIESFDGTITVDSRVNEGTTFLIQFPIIAREEDVK